MNQNVTRLADAINARERRYEELRQATLGLLFVRAKLRAEAATDERTQRLATRLKTLTEELARCRAELDDLRHQRLDAAASHTFADALMADV